MFKRFWRAETGIFLGLWLGLLIAGRSRLFGDPGTLWHVVVGRGIVTSGHFPTSDSFTFTHSGQPWIAQQWLGECAMALLHDGVGGLDTLLLATATLIAGFYTWVAFRLMRAGIHWLLALLVVAFALFASAYHLHPRPHLVNIVFLGVTFAWLCDYGAGRIPLRRLFWLVPLYVIWTNVHGGMVGGVATIGLATAGWAVAWWIGWNSPLGQKWHQVQRSLLALFLLVSFCGLTALVNPYGTDLPRVWFALMGSKVLPQLIIEHAPLRYAPREGLAVLAFALVYLAALVGTMPMRPRISWLIPLVWLVLAWDRIRHGPLFAVTAAIAVGDIYPHIRWARWLERRGSTVFPLQPVVPRSRMGLILPGLLVAAALFLQVGGIRVPVLGRDWVELDPTHWPVDLLPQLKAYEASYTEGTPVFNDMLFGGFLIYYTPGLRIFIDDRCELYGDQYLLDYANVIQDRPEMIEQWSDVYGFNLAITAPDSGFDKYLRSAARWRLVSPPPESNQQAPAAHLFRRVTS